MSNIRERWNTKYNGWKVELAEAKDRITTLEAEIKRLREALLKISLGSQNSMTTKKDMGMEVREALASTTGGKGDE